MSDRDRDDDRLKATLGAVSLSAPGVGVDDVLRRAAAEQRSRRAMVRMAMAAAGVWLMAWIAQVAVERGVTAVGDGSATMAATVGDQGKELTTGWLVWLRKFAEGLSLEDVGAEMDAPTKPPAEKKDDGVPDKQGMREGVRDQVERRAGRRAYV